MKFQTNLIVDGQICKDKDEAEVWFVGLKALITRGNYRKWRVESRCESISSDSPHARIRKNSPSTTPCVCTTIIIIISISTLSPLFLVCSSNFHFPLLLVDRILQILMGFLMKILDRID